MVTWVIDDIGCAGAILDEFCIRNLAGDTVGWVFGLSVFSRQGEHIGWYEDGVFYDIENNVLGFLAGAKGLPPDAPALAPPPPAPTFSKRPCVPALRGRAARPPGRGWSAACLSSYFSYAGQSAAHAPFVPHTMVATPLGTQDLSP